MTNSCTTSSHYGLSVWLLPQRQKHILLHFLSILRLKITYITESELEPNEVLSGVTVAAIFVLGKGTLLDGFTCKNADPVDVDPPEEMCGLR